MNFIERIKIHATINFAGLQFVPGPGDRKGDGGDGWSLLRNATKKFWKGFSRTRVSQIIFSASQRNKEVLERFLKNQGFSNHLLCFATQQRGLLDFFSTFSQLGLHLVFEK